MFQNNQLHTRLKEYGVLINANKCVWRNSQIILLGYGVSASGTRPHKGSSYPRSSQFPRSSAAWLKDLIRIDYICLLFKSRTKPSIAARKKFFRPSGFGSWRNILALFTSCQEGIICSSMDMCIDLSKLWHMLSI